MEKPLAGEATRRRLARRMALGGWALLSGCTNPGDVYRLEPAALGDPPGLLDRAYPEDRRVTGVAVDAKQRFVWGPVLPMRVVNGVEPNGVATFAAGTRRIVCAEPSPDALSTFSAQVSGALCAEIAAKGSVGGEFAQSISEAARILGQRTATMQLLRDGYYRACEAYGNGLLDSFGYALILNKIDELMVELVAIEALAQGQITTADQTKIKEAAQAEAKEGVDLAALERARAADIRAQSELRRLQAEERSASVRQAELEARKAQSDSIVAQGSEAAKALPAARNESLGLTRKIAEKDTEIADQDRIIAEELAKPQPNQQMIATAETRKKTLDREKASFEEQKRTTVDHVASLERQEARGRQEADDAAALAAQVASARTAAEAAKGARTTAETTAGNARTALTTAESTAGTSIADAEGKRALLGTIRPEISPAAMGQILEIVRLSETSDGTRGNSTLKGACAMWFAQHPQVKTRLVGNVLQFVGAEQPAIAHLCMGILTEAPSASPQSSSGAEPRRR